MSERLEVRRNDDGTIDEVLVYVGDRCVVHIEQMTKRTWYLGVYIGEAVDQFSIEGNRRVRVRHYHDER